MRVSWPVVLVAIATTSSGRTAAADGALAPATIVSPAPHTPRLERGPAVIGDSLDPERAPRAVRYRIRDPGGLFGLPPWLTDAAPVGGALLVLGTALAWFTSASRRRG
jgi:hypothetical protein